MPPLNDFQALMRSWTTLGPYNAIDLIKVPGRTDAARWHDAIVQLMAGLGIEPPAIIDASYPQLTAGITAELNEPFAPDEPPIRFFTAGEDAAGHYFGATFDHWIADSPSYRFLTRRAFENYMEPGAAAKLPPLKLCQKRFEELFGRQSRVAAVIEGVQTYLRHASAYRLPIHEPLDLSSGFQHLQLPNGLIGHVRQFGKKLGATVNDVFLAVLLQTLGDFTKSARSNQRKRLLRSKRDGVAFYTAADIRPLANESIEDQIGCFISYFSLILKNPEEIPLPDLVKRIAAQTQTIKSDRQVLRFFQGFGMMRLFWNYYRKPRQRALLFNRSVPCLGGISNVNLTDTWIGRDARILDYLRVSPTGPLAPIIFTPSTIGDRLSLCVTHRNAVFSNEQAAGVVANFSKRLAAI